MAETFFIDGNAIKNLKSAVDLPQYPDSAWTFFTNPPDPKNIELYAEVPAVFRVITMSADAIADMPFVLLDENENEYDSSENWQNKIGFMENPRDLLRLWRMSLFMTNKAYGFMEGNKVIKNLKYISPETITIKADAKNGLIGFTRSVGDTPQFYKVEQNVILYFHWLDYTTECIPTKFSEFHALLNAAGVLNFADIFIRRFFQRGGINPSMLQVKGMVRKERVEEIEKIWDKVVRGFYEYLGKVFQGLGDTGGIEVVKLGDGLENIGNTGVHREKLEDIALAAGMPLSLLLANSANYATANVEYATWFNHSVIPKAKFMQEVLNAQIFKNMGLKWEFRPEVTNAGTEEEVDRSRAFALYVNAGVPGSIAAQLVGLDMPPDVEYEDLDAKMEETQLRKEQHRAEIMQRSQDDRPIRQGGEQERPAKAIVDYDQLHELDNWRQIAISKFKRNESLKFPWVAVHIDEAMASKIRDELPNCKSIAEIETIFIPTEQKETKQVDSLLELAKSINLAVETVATATKPSVRIGESRKDFVKRCVPHVLERETDNPEQAVTICHGIYDKYQRDKKKVKYSPDQPRVPAGSPEGGRWTSSSRYRIREFGQAHYTEREREEISDEIEYAVGANIYPEDLSWLTPQEVELIPELLEDGLTYFRIGDADMAVAYKGDTPSAIAVWDINRRGDYRILYALSLDRGAGFQLITKIIEMAIEDGTGISASSRHGFLIKRLAERFNVVVEDIGTMYQPIRIDKDALAEVYERFSKYYKSFKYSPDQPRVPAGVPEGGQFTTNKRKWIEFSGKTPKDERDKASIDLNAKFLLTKEKYKRETRSDDDLGHYDNMLAVVMMETALNDLPFIRSENTHMRIKLDDEGLPIAYIRYTLEPHNEYITVDEAASLTRGDGFDLIKDVVTLAYFWGLNLEAKSRHADLLETISDKIDGISLQPGERQRYRTVNIDKEAIKKLYKLFHSRFATKYSPDQPRVPAGVPEGGQFARKYDIVPLTHWEMNEELTVPGVMLYDILKAGIEGAYEKYGSDFEWMDERILDYAMMTEGELAYKMMYNAIAYIADFSSAKGYVVFDKDDLPVGILSYEVVNEPVKEVRIAFVGAIQRGAGAELIKYTIDWAIENGYGIRTESRHADKLKLLAKRYPGIHIIDDDRNYKSVTIDAPTLKELSSLFKKFFKGVKYSPNQPRVPAGVPEGGRFTSKAGWKEYNPFLMSDKRRKELKDELSEAFDKTEDKYYKFPDYDPGVGHGHPTLAMEFLENIVKGVYEPTQDHKKRIRLAFDEEGLPVAGVSYTVESLYDQHLHILAAGSVDGNAGITLIKSLLKYAYIHKNGIIAESRHSDLLEKLAQRFGGEVNTGHIYNYIRFPKESVAKIYNYLKRKGAIKYSPDQPRVPAGVPEGGRWVAEVDVSWIEEEKLREERYDRELQVSDKFPEEGQGSKVIFWGDYVYSLSELPFHAPILAHIVLENEDLFSQELVSEASLVIAEERIDDSNFEQRVKKIIDAYSVEVDFTNNITIVAPPARTPDPSPVEWNRFLRRVQRWFDRGMIDYPKAKRIALIYESHHLNIPYSEIQLIRNVTVDEWDKPLFHYKYSPDQPRVPAGVPEGGRWTSKNKYRIEEYDYRNLNDYVLKSKIIETRAKYGEASHFTTAGVFEEADLAYGMMDNAINDCRQYNDYETKYGYDLIVVYDEEGLPIAVGSYRDERERFRIGNIGSVVRGAGFEIIKEIFLKAIEKDYYIETDTRHWRGLEKLIERIPGIEFTDDSYYYRGVIINHEAIRQLVEIFNRTSKSLKYSPDQPRVPAGSPEGGRWTTDNRIKTLKEAVEWLRENGVDYVRRGKALQITVVGEEPDPKVEAEWKKDIIDSVNAMKDVIETTNIKPPRGVDYGGDLTCYKTYEDIICIGNQFEYTLDWQDYEQALYKEMEKENPDQKKIQQLRQKVDAKKKGMQGDHSMYHWDMNEAAYGFMLHELGHHAHITREREFDRLVGLKAIEHGLGEESLSSMKRLFGVTRRAKDNWRECVAENFVLWFSKKKEIDPFMKEVFDEFFERSD